MIYARLLWSGFIALALLSLAIATGAAASHHEAERDVSARPENAPAWDQTKATSAAQSLAASLEGLRAALRRQPTTTIAPGGGSRARNKLLDRLRLMESESKHLARVLEEGQGRDETLPVFERINEIRRFAVEQAQRMFLQKPVIDKIESARGSLEVLAGLYGVELNRTLEIR